MWRLGPRETGGLAPAHVMAETDKSVKALLVGCAFEPADVIPKEFNFDAVLPKDKKKNKKNEQRMIKKMTRLENYPDD